METKQKVLEFRERLDKTLASHDLLNEEYVKTLVKNQLLRSSPSKMQGYIENFVEKRTKEVSNFLDMLRSASRNDSEVSKIHGTAHGDWKLKQDNDDYRVMYREGPQGTPFHTLLVEGYVDGPVDVCLCVSWESVLYKKWWPQYSIPTFKITSSNCLQKVRIGEQISLVRMKVPWPVSAREAVAHYFELEYFEGDLIIVLLSSVSDIESVDKHTHGFTNEGIPEAKDTVRIDFVGGFALQKVTSNRSYFRTIATMDIKLDFVPPSFINFISRQLIGSGFKLYQKAVASVAKGDEEFGKALKDPMYIRIREGLNHEKKLRKSLGHEALEIEKSTRIFPEELATETLQADTPVIDQSSLGDHRAIEIPHSEASIIGQTPLCEIEEEVIKQEAHLEENGEIEIPHSEASIIGQTPLCEIKEEVIEQEAHLEENGESMDHPSNNLTAEQCHVSKDKMVFISLEVERALGILDNVISRVREGGFRNKTWSGFGSTHQELPNLERVAAEVGSTSLEDGSNGGVFLEAPKMENMDRALYETVNGSDVLDFRCNKPDSPLREVSHNQIEPVSPQRNSPILDKTQRDALSSSKNGTTAEAPVLNNMSNDDKEVTVKVNGTHEGSFNGEKKIKHKKQRLCCLNFISGHS